MNEILYLNGINISIIYVIMMYFLMNQSIKLYDWLVKDKIDDCYKNVLEKQRLIRPIMASGSVELFTHQRDMYASLFKLCVLGFMRFGIIIVSFFLVSLIPFSITAPYSIPLFFDTNLSFNIETNPVMAFFNIFIYAMIIGLGLNIIKVIIYNKKKETKSNEIKEVEEDEWN